MSPRFSNLREFHAQATLAIVASTNSSMSDPLAYLLTFTTYGTWLHGDARGSRHHGEVAYPTLPIDPNPRWLAAERAVMAGSPITFDIEARRLVERVVAEVCVHKGWVLHAVNARTQHVHVVVSGRPGAEPAEMMGAIKAWASRRLGESGFAVAGARVWTRHGSTVFLWRQRALAAAIHYVLFRQDEEKVRI